MFLIFHKTSKYTKMKTSINQLCFFSLLLLFTQDCWAQFRIRNDEYLQIGYDDYRTLTFGTSTGNPNNGAWGVEYWQGGLNFWKPWPTANFDNYVLFLRDDKNVAIGFPGLSGYKLSVLGTVIALNYTTFSDSRFKRELQPLDGSLGKILKLNGQSFYLASQAISTIYETSTKMDSATESKRNITRSNALPEDKDRRIGLIAQEVKEIIPEVVKADGQGYLSIDYTGLIPVLIEAIKEQQGQISELQRTIGELERKISK